MVLLGLLAIVLVACGSGQGGASTAASADEDTAATESMAAEESAAEESADAGDGGVGGATNPSFEAGAGDLDAILPDEVGGITIEYESASGEEVVSDESGVTPEAQEFFDAVGAQPSQLSSAFGLGLDTETGTAVTIIAFRVQGANEDQLRDEFARTLEEDGSTLTEANVAGKDVLAIDQDTEQGGFLYVANDIIFMVAASSQELAEEALSLLP